jgi:hypothetical protein
MGYNNRGDGVQWCQTNGDGAAETVPDEKSQIDKERTVVQANPTTPMLL